MPNDKLKGRILGMYKTEAEFARKIGWTRQRLNKITNGLKEPDVGELQVLANGLCLSVSTLAKFFLHV